MSTTDTRPTVHVRADTLAAEGVTFDWRGERWTFDEKHHASRVPLVKVPHEIRVHFEYDDAPDWSWLDQEHERDHWQHDPDTLDGIRYGDFGPIDSEGREHFALGIVVTRVYPDGSHDVVDSLWSIDHYVNDRSLIGITEDGPFDLDDLRAWIPSDPDAEYDGRAQLAVEALSMIPEEVRR